MIFLDTMALLYFLGGSRAMPVELREAIISTPVVYVSVASFWEIGIKGSAGKVDLDGRSISTPNDVEELLQSSKAQGFHVLPISEPDVLRAPFLGGPHKDPFDRMIVAQALERNAVLFSNDAILDSLSPALQRRWADPTNRPLSQA